MTDTSKLEQLKDRIFKTVYYNLGGDIVDNELDPNHYEYAYRQAVETYRQRSSNASEESYIFLTLVPDVNEYTLPTEITDVQQIFRRTIGSGTNSSTTNFEPFEAGYMNMYMLQNSRVGGLLNYELFAGYQELSFTMFGGYINYHYNRGSRRLTIMRRPRGENEDVLLWVYNYKPEFVLLEDQMIYPWIRDYTNAVCKRMVGEAREKFASIAGPSGGTSLNGSTLKNEADQEITQLKEDLRLLIDGQMPSWFTIG